ncbi:MAG TPA: acyl-CoA synthetase [Stellaceae bacterium]|nr:acyl-CoA synthetase [Stellaceae bacterium]
MPHPRHWAARTPEKPAIVMAGTGRTVTYRALDASADRLAQLLRARGLATGDVIAALMENRPEFFEIFWAAQRSGLYFTPVSWRLKPEEIAYILVNSGAKAAFGSRRHAALVLAALDGTAIGQRFCIDGEEPGFEPLGEAIAAFPAEPIADESLGRDLLYSSGTTGRPKGVKNALPDGEVTTIPPVMAFMSRLYGFDEATVLLTPTPLYHASGLRYGMVAGHAGSTNVIMESFDPEAALMLIERHCVTHFAAVPTLFVRLLRLPPETRRRYDLSSLKMVLHGTGPCGREIKQAVIDWLGPVLYENYGGTEGNGLCAIGPDEWQRHPGSVGKAVVGKLHIVGPDGREVPAGEEGLVYFDGGPRFEYHGDPAKTAAAYSPEGWSTLGDIGYVDDEGYLHLTDRQSHMIISGGVNIYPQEVEDLLLSHPAVLDAAVFGVPNAEFGEEVKAVVHPVSPEDAGPVLAQALIDFCRARMAHYKCPRSVDFSTGLPRHETGKIYKRLLKLRYAESTEAPAIR